MTLSVSNNSPCDEFYEIFDALYTSAFVVKDMEVVKAKRSYKDRLRNANYATTEFKKAVDEFCLPALHEGPTSLFEIPVAYYASLPNSKRYDGELTALVDAVIKVFEHELSLCEDEDDVKFILCKILEEQEALMMKNYRKFDTLSCGVSPKDNPILDIIYRRIKHVIESTPEPSDYLEMLERMKRSLK